MVKLDSIMKDFNKKPEEKPADKKPEPEKTIETITGGSNLPEKKDTIEKKDIFPIKSQTQIGSVVPKAQVVIKAPPQTPPVQEPEKKPFVLPPFQPTTQTASEKRPTTYVVPKDEDFNLSSAFDISSHIILPYGDKGDGKTWASMSIGGSQFWLSFDNKTESIRRESFSNKPITVKDAVRYYDRSSPEAWILSSDASMRYINMILNQIPDIDESHPPTDKNPDWIGIDCGEIYELMSEMEMRYNNNLKAFEGFANKNLWKERRMYIDNLLRRCIRKAKKGVIWTCYTDRKEIIDKGEFITKKDVPKWIDAVLRETDVVIRVERESTKDGQHFFATVESSKWSKIPECGRTEITKKGLPILIKGDL